jgi:hypothetical protein
VAKWRYGLTLVPRDKTLVEGRPAVDALVRARRDLGWEFLRITERDDSEMLVFRRPA